MPDFDLEAAMRGNNQDPEHRLEKKRWFRKDFRGQTRDAQKLENNSYLTRFPYTGAGGGYIYTIRLHDTDVLTQWPDGSVGVSSGGWQTVTTKARINDYLAGMLPNAARRPLLYQRNREWFWSAGWGEPDARGHQQPNILGDYADGDWFSADGQLHKDQRRVQESVGSAFDVESAACNYIEQEVGRYDWKANWEHHRQQPGVEPKVQAWLDHYEYGGTASEVITFITDTMMKSDGKWR